MARPRSLWQWTDDGRLAADAVDDPLDQPAELGRDRVADGVRDVDRGGARRRRPPRRPASRKSRSVREASSAENSISASAPSACGRRSPSGRPRASASSRSMRSLCLRWMSRRGDEDVEVRPLGAADRLHGALRIAVLAARERRDGDAAGSPAAIRWTASKSPGEAAGKPASMTSTLRRTSWRATSSFSAAVRPAPGACSPSRRVVSKIRTEPRIASGVRHGSAHGRSCAGPRPRRAPAERLGLAGRRPRPG